MESNIIVVTGMDHSGTSLIAGMMHHIGVDMGHIETGEDLAALKAIVRQTTPYFDGRERDYLSFECQQLSTMMVTGLRGSNVATYFNSNILFDRFKDYVEERDLSHPSGVKNTLLTLLGYHPNVATLPVKWIISSRPLDEVFASGIKYFGTTTALARYGAEMRGRQHLGRHLLCEQVPHLTLAFHAILDYPDGAIDLLSDYCQIDPTGEQRRSACDFIESRSAWQTI